MLAPQAETSIMRDVHLLLEQMYDALDKRPFVDRDRLRDLTDNLSDVIMPLTMVAAMPQLMQEFAKPELNAAEFTPVEALIVSILDRNFGKVVTKDFLRATLTERSPSKNEADAKLTEVHICKIRAKLKGSPYGVRTQWGVGYVLDHAEKCPASLAAIAAQARAAKRPTFRGVSFTEVGAAIMAYLEANMGKDCSIYEIMAAVPQCERRQTVYNTISRARGARLNGVYIRSGVRRGFRMGETP